MLRKRSLVACAGAAAAMMAMVIPASASASTGRQAAEPRGFTTSSCSGTVFSNTKFQNVASHTYLAQSTTSDAAVLFSGTNQTFDGFRDSAGHLIIYRCGTNDVLTDGVNSKCMKDFKDCLYVENYTDSSDQWWTRITGKTNWSIQTLDPAGDSKVLADPRGSKAVVQVVVSGYTAGLNTQEWNVISG
jgi:hypothetical protein